MKYEMAADQVLKRFARQIRKEDAVKPMRVGDVIHVPKHVTDLGIPLLHRLEISEILSPQEQAAVFVTKVLIGVVA